MQRVSVWTGSGTVMPDAPAAASVGAQMAEITIIGDDVGQTTTSAPRRTVSMCSMQRARSLAPIDGNVARQRFPSLPLRTACRRSAETAEDPAGRRALGDGVRRPLGGPVTDQSIASSGGFVHEACLYRADDEVLGIVVPFLREAHERGDAAVVDLDERKSRRLRDELGSGADDIEFVGGRWYTNPASAIREHLGCFQSLASDGNGRAVRAVGELPPGSVNGSWPAWRRYEAPINVAFEPLPCTSSIRPPPGSGRRRTADRCALDRRPRGALRPGSGIVSNAIATALPR
jgi:hypothetical protein